MKVFSLRNGKCFCVRSLALQNKARGSPLRVGILVSYKIPEVRPHYTAILIVVNFAHSLGQRPVPLELSLIPANTTLEFTTDGAPVEISESASRTFFCVLTVAEQIEQESLDVSIWGSPDGQDFGKRPLLKLPQQFYCGTTKMILDVSFRPEIKFLRARWELNRWGRVSPTPRFVASLQLEEIPPMSRDTTTKRAVLASKS
jgi:hypothetical protein